MNPQHIITTKHFPALAYQRYGTGPVIMLIHGFPASGSLWNKVAASLSQAYTVLVPDLPGTGDSRLDGEAVTMAELATIVPAILDDAGVDQCIVAGHSMGGYVGLAAAAQYPDRLNGLALVHSTTAADSEEKKDKRTKTIALIRKGGREEFIKGMIPALFSKAYKQAHPEAVNQWIDEGMKLPAETMIAFYNAMMVRPERMEVIHNVPFPVQWILGKDDTQIPWQSCLQQSSLPSVSFITMYSDCGHMSMVEQPVKLEDDLHGFIKYCTQKVEEVQTR